MEAAHLFPVRVLLYSNHHRIPQVIQKLSFFGAFVCKTAKWDMSMGEKREGMTRSIGAQVGIEPVSLQSISPTIVRKLAGSATGYKYCKISLDCIYI